RNITERKAAEAKIQRYTKLYTALSQCNKSIVHCTSEDELFLQACRAAVQFGGMKMAWVGLVDSETRMVRPVASFGDDSGYLNDLSISVDADNPFGLGPIGTAIRENRLYWCQDYMGDPSTAPWHQRAVLAGLAASASLPLHRNGVVIGAFTLFSGEINPFDEAARDLLVEMSTDISFALDNFVRESQRKRAEEEIKFKNTILKTQLETSLDAILVVGENGQIISCNQQFIDLWQLSPQIVSARLDKPVLQLVADQVENSEASVARIQYLNEHRDDKSREEISLKDGRIIDQYSAPVTGADGKYYGRVWYFRDITESKQSEERITFLNRVYAVLSGINSLIVRVLDRDELFRQACNIAVGAGGFPIALITIVDWETMKIVLVASAGKDAALVNAVKNTFSSGELAASSMIVPAIRENKVVVSNDTLSDPRVLLGKQYAESGIRSMIVLPLLAFGEAVGMITLYASEVEFFHDAEIKLLTELAGDVSFAIDHIGKQERLDYIAYYDTLTGLANRMLFLERVTQYMRGAVQGGYKLAIGLIDLERFKNINDSLGRVAGDALLTQVAEWMTQNAGDANLLARIDADHFALVMPEIRHDEDLARLVEKTMAAFAQHPFLLNDTVFRIGIKIGIALFPDDGGDADTLLRNAEAALKKAKESGERYLFHTQKMTEAVAGKLTLENQLRQAYDNEEFVLHYQPKVNLVSGMVTSAEALIRWNDPRSGLVPPGQFIPILEETGLIYEVGRWALRQALADYLRWRAMGLPAVRIAVNVSSMQLRNINFIDEIRQVIALDSHAAAGLELEITESLIMTDVKHSIAGLQAIRAMGVTIAIDDFGTGFSSLSYLARLPVDTLKIDRSFVTGMAAGPEGLALVSTIIKLAHSLNLKVVAEGVETREQSRLLRLLNCDEMQGFLFSKAVASEIFEAKFLALAADG
ncbi:MAG: bifunctional diguanylate cyclase/phosphodiesterase, partial [Gallionella sp.]